MCQMLTLPIHSGVLPNAVLPPSLDHVYAQWRQQEPETPESGQPPGDPSAGTGKCGLEARAPALVGQAPGPDAWTVVPILLPALQGKDPVAFSHVDDPRQCALCLKYGDADSKVRATA